MELPLSKSATDDANFSATVQVSCFFLFSLCLLDLFSLIGVTVTTGVLILALTPVFALLPDFGVFGVMVLSELF